MLSAEAKVFIPRQQQGSTDVVENGLLSPGAAGTQMTDGLLDGEVAYPGQHPINGLPSYITTCYPFVSGAEPRYKKFVTVKILKFRTPNKFAVIILKLEQYLFTTE